MNRYKSNTKHQIICNDAAKIINEIPKSSIQLIVTSPPYNIGKEYESNERLTLDEYLSWIKPIIQELAKLLTPTGSICWQVGNYVHKGELFPLDLYFFQIFKSLGFKLRNRIVWQYNFGLNATNKFSGRYETILWFTKEDNYKFNLDPIRIPQLYPGKRHASSKGNKAGAPSGNPLGKNPSDFWRFSGRDAFIENPVWEIPNIKASHPEKTIHPCQFPSELVERCVLAFTDVDDCVLDPFVGAGTSVIAALKHDRRAIGIEKDSRYAKLGNERIQAFTTGKLRFRKPGKQIHKPKGTEKVSQLPEQWRMARSATKDE